MGDTSVHHGPGPVRVPWRAIVIAVTVLLLLTLGVLFVRMVRSPPPAAPTLAPLSAPESIPSTPPTNLPP